jgi:hypothetical protein
MRCFDPCKFLESDSQVSVEVYNCTVIIGIIFSDYRIILISCFKSHLFITINACGILFFLQNGKKYVYLIIINNINKTSVSFINKTDRHDITEILLKVALITLTIFSLHFRPWRLAQLQQQYDVILQLISCFKSHLFITINACGILFFLQNGKKYAYLIIINNSTIQKSLGSIIQRSIYLSLKVMSVFWH